jgi:hypothetical protein
LWVLSMEIAHVTLRVLGILRGLLHFCKICAPLGDRRMRTVLIWGKIGGQVAGFCEHSNEPSCYTKYEEFLDKKKDHHVPCSWLIRRFVV